MNLADWNDLEMQPFSLQYKGPLRADQTGGAKRRQELSDIRQAFHHQLPRAWQLSELLRLKYRGIRAFPYRGETITLDGNPPIIHKPDVEWVRVARWGLDFVPLVIRSSLVSMICELDIRLRWREKRRGGIFSGFDIDSRLKGLIDALTVPADENQMPIQFNTSTAPNPFLCLLENDNLVSRLSIKAEPNLLPLRKDEHDGWIEVEIDIQVHLDEPNGEL